VRHDWSSKTKKIRTEFNLVKRPYILDTRAINKSALAGIFKAIAVK